MSALSDVRDGIKTRLATISGLHTHDVMPDSVVVPAAIVRPLRGDYYSSLSNRPRLSFEILLVVALARLEKAQDNLDAYLASSGVSSIVAAIEGDPTLNSKAETSLIMGWRDYGSIIIGGVEYLSCRLDLEVYTA